MSRMGLLSHLSVRPLVFLFSFFYFQITTVPQLTYIGCYAHVGIIFLSPEIMYIHKIHNNQDYLGQIYLMSGNNIH